MSKFRHCRRSFLDRFLDIEGVLHSIRIQAGSWESHKSEFIRSKAYYLGILHMCLMSN